MQLLSYQMPKRLLLILVHPLQLRPHLHQLFQSIQDSSLSSLQVRKPGSSLILLIQTSTLRPPGRKLLWSPSLSNWPTNQTSTTNNLDFPCIPSFYTPSLLSASSASPPVPATPASLLLHLPLSPYGDSIRTLNLHCCAYANMLLSTIHHPCAHRRTLSIFYITLQIREVRLTGL